MLNECLPTHIPWKKVTNNNPAFPNEARKVITTLIIPKEQPTPLKMIHGVIRQ